MARRKQQSGMTLIEALMASALLAMAAAGILLPITAAAAAQTDAQRRVIATRFAADVIEWYIADPDLPLSDKEVFPSDLNYPDDLCYAKLTALIEFNPVSDPPTLSLVTVSVKDGDRPMVILKTLIGDGHL